MCHLLEELLKKISGLVISRALVGILSRTGFSQVFLRKLLNSDEHMAVSQLTAVTVSL